ncbi:hypothetical protein B0H14DRAFT_2587536 [Mycena olivaceomarginata]|nr:hypothetical protein B0H14DRAFT_2587536 [Mycena olivaceomarginata]
MCAGAVLLNGRKGVQRAMRSSLAISAPIHNGAPFSGGIDGGCIGGVLSSSACRSGAYTVREAAARGRRLKSRGGRIDRGWTYPERATKCATYSTGEHFAVCGLLRFRSLPLPRHVPPVLCSSGRVLKHPLSSASPDPSRQLRSVPAGFRARNAQDARCTSGSPISRSPWPGKRRRRSGLDRERAAPNLVRPLANYKARTARSARYNKHSKKGRRASETHDAFVPRGIRHKQRPQGEDGYTTPGGWRAVRRPQDEDDEGGVYIAVGEPKDRGRTCVAVGVRRERISYEWLCSPACGVAD